jgi:hypothetical protein
MNFHQNGSAKRLEAIRNWLLSMPFEISIMSDWQFLDENGIDYGAITENKNSDKKGAGAALQFRGENDISPPSKINVLGKPMLHVFSRFQFNAALIMWRDVSDGEFYEKISDVNMGIIKWVYDEQKRRGTHAENPLLPNFGDNPAAEIVTARDGSEGLILPGGRREFIIYLQFTYEVKNN